VEFFGKTNINFLSKMWYFIGLSLVFSVAGVISMLFIHHIPLSVDFRGGTEVLVKFAQKPNTDQLRSQLDAAGLHNFKLQSYSSGSGDNGNTLKIVLDIQENGAGDQTQGKQTVIRAMLGPAAEGKININDSAAMTLEKFLVSRDPLAAGSNAAQQYSQIAQQIVTYRDQQKHGVLSSMSELSGVAPASVVTALDEGFVATGFAVEGGDVIGPQVGSQMRNQALRAVIWSLMGMLVYLWVRFELIYGVAAVVACFHDTLITIGMFSLLNEEISLTVIAAILTLVGYSMNDTIVVFDRIRENVKTMRKESLSDIVNLSINQTLSRTVLTSGLTFLTVLALFIFGGEVLHGFSLALVIGILIGTYSSIFIAAPILVEWQKWRAKKSGGEASLPAMRG